MESCKQSDRRLIQFSRAADSASTFPTSGMRQQSVAEVLDAPVDEGMIFLGSQNRGNMVSIGGTPQDGQANVAHVHVQAVFAVVEQAEAVGYIPVARGAGNIHPGLR